MGWAGATGAYRCPPAWSLRPGQGGDWDLLFAPLDIGNNKITSLPACPRAEGRPQRGAALGERQGEGGVGALPFALAPCASVGTRWAALGLAGAPVPAPMGAHGAVSPANPRGCLMTLGRARGARGASQPSATAGRGQWLCPVPAMGVSPSSAPTSRPGARAAGRLFQPFCARGGGEAPPHSPHCSGKGDCVCQLLQCWHFQSCSAHVSWLFRWEYPHPRCLSFPVP